MQTQVRIIQSAILPIVVAAIWISFSEFVRNELLLKSFWTSHYDTLGLTFPSAPSNGAIWVVWSFIFAMSIYILATKFTTTQTIAVAWLMGFVLMWLVIGNLNVLPFAMLLYAIPLSLVETAVATLIVKKLSPQTQQSQ